MKAAWLIAAKDLRERLRDRSVIIFGLVAPLGLAYIFSTVFNFGSSLSLHYAVVDEDGGPFAVVLVDEVLSGLVDSGVATVEERQDRTDALAAVETGELTGAFVVPGGFSDAVTTGRPATLEVAGNVDAEIGTAVATGVAEAFAAELEAIQLSVAMAAAGSDHDPVALTELAAAAAEETSPIRLGTVRAADKQLPGPTYLSAGMAVFFLFFVVQFGVTSLLEERREGTLVRLLAAPIPRAAIYGGKGLTSFLLGVASMTVLMVASAVLIGAEWGPVGGVALLVLGGVVAAVGLMAVLATIARTAEQAGVWQSIIAVVLGAIGGAFFPVAQGSDLLAQVSLLTPHQWFLRGLADIRGAGTATAAVPAAAVLAGFGLVAATIAAARLPGEALR